MASKHETVVEAIKAALEGIVAGVDGYVYTPDRVWRVSFFPDNVTPDSTLETIYQLRPGLEPSGLGPDSCQMFGDLELFLLVARRIYSPSENQETPERWQVAADLAADAKQALFTDHTFGGVAKHIVDNRVETNFDLYTEGWALAELHFTVRYLTNRPGR